VTAVLRAAFDGADHLCTLGNVKPVLSHVEEHQARGPRGGELSPPQALLCILAMIMVPHERLPGSHAPIGTGEGAPDSLKL
jgi:hypothetical protein